MRMHSPIFYTIASSLGPRQRNDFFLSTLEPVEESDMSRENRYLDKAKACADAATEAHYPRERVKVWQLGRRFNLLAEHAARCQEHGTHREDNTEPRHTYLARFR